MHNVLSMSFHKWHTHSIVVDTVCRMICALWTNKHNETHTVHNAYKHLKQIQQSLYLEIIAIYQLLHGHSLIVALIRPKTVS